MKLLIENWRKFLEEEVLEEGVESLHLPGIINTKILETITGGHAQNTFGKYFKEIAPLLYSSTMHSYVRAATDSLQYAFEDWIEKEMPRNKDPEKRLAALVKGPDQDAFTKFDRERSRQYRGVSRLKRTLVDKIEGELVDKGHQEDVREGGYSDLYIELVNQMRPDEPYSSDLKKSGKDFWKFLRGYIKNVKKTVAKINFGVAGKDMAVDDFIKQRFLELFYPKVDEIYLRMWELTTGKTHEHRLDTSGIPKVSMQGLIEFLNEHEKNWTKVDEIYNEYDGHPDMWSETLNYLEEQKYKVTYKTNCKGEIVAGEPCVILRLKDDWFWYNRGTNACSVFARELANCGDTTRTDSVLLDLQQFSEGDKKPKYAVGIEWHDRDQTIYQILGNANSFPDRKYWPQIKSIYEYLGKPEIDSDSFSYISGVKPRDLERLTKELFKAIGFETLDEWDLLRLHLKRGEFTMAGKNPHFDINLSFQEVVPQEGVRMAVAGIAKFAHKIQIDLMPDQFISDLYKWMADESNPEIDERVEKASDALEFALISASRNSKYFQELGWKPKTVLFARRNWTGTSSGTQFVWLYNLEINQFQTRWGATQTGAVTPDTIRKFIRTARRNMRLPVFQGEVGNPANDAWVQELGKMYPNAVPFGDSENLANLFSESKKIKVSIIK